MKIYTAARGIEESHAGRSRATGHGDAMVRSPQFRSHHSALVLLLLAALVVRLYGVTSPLVDSLHQRQTQTAMVARNLYRDGLKVWMTRYDHMGFDDGYAILEFPLYNVS